MTEKNFSIQLQLENVSKVLTQEVENQQTGMHDSGEEITHKGREGSPFSARAALRQTQEILSSTQRKTKAVLSSVTDAAWWKEAVNALSLPTYHKTPKKGDCDYGNSGFNKQGCHPFYETVVDNCHLDTVSFSCTCIGRVRGLVNQIKGDVHVVLFCFL